MDTTTFLRTLELEPCDHCNIAELNVSQQQLSALDAPSPHKSLCITKS